MASFHQWELCLLDIHKPRRSREFTGCYAEQKASRTALKVILRHLLKAQLRNLEGWERDAEVSTSWESGSPAMGLYSFAGVAITNRVASNNRNLSTHCSGGWKFKIKVLARLIPFEGFEGRTCLKPFFLGSRWPSSRWVSTSSSLSVYLTLCPDLPIF